MNKTPEALFVKAVNSRNDLRPPIWLMRQAGRYLPEYRQLRQRHSFNELIRTPDLAAAVTHLPIDLIGFDAAILFSDILVILDSLGVSFRMEEGVGPVIENPLRCIQDIESLHVRHPRESLDYTYQTIQILKKSLKVPLIGFAGAPFTVASYLIEGGSSKNLKKTREWLYRAPEAFASLLNKIADQTALYLDAQIAAGVDAIQIFDTWSCYLSVHQFQEFSFRIVKNILSKIRSCPTIFFCKNSQLFLNHLVALNPSVLSLDFQCDIQEVRKIVPSSIGLQGNLDPDLLYQNPATIRKYAQVILDGMRHQPGFIFNLGHGVYPDVPVENVRCLVEYVQGYQ